MQKKIRTAQKAKVPFMLIAGGEDAAAGAVSFRYRDGTQHNGVPVDEAVADIVDAVHATRTGVTGSMSELNDRGLDGPEAYAGTADGFERLWTPHRMVYIQGENKPPTGRAGDCPFCTIPDSRRPRPV